MGNWLPAKKNHIHAHVKAMNRPTQRKPNQTFTVTTKQSRLSGKEKVEIGNVNETTDPVSPEGRGRINN